MKFVLSVLCFVAAVGVAAGRPESRSDPGVTVEVGTTGVVMVKRVLPSYPVVMRQRGIEGIVELDIIVDAEGRVVGITTVSATNGSFVTPTRDAVWQWQFAKSGQLRPDDRVCYRIPVEFRLRRG